MTGQPQRDAWRGRRPTLATLAALLVTVVAVAVTSGCASVTDPAGNTSSANLGPALAAPRPGTDRDLTLRPAMPGNTALAAPRAQSVEVAGPSQTNASAVDAVNPSEPVNFNAPQAHADLWARLRAGFAMPALESDLVRKWEQWYASKPDYVQRMTERGGRYLFHIVEALSRDGLPTELALLPFVESAFNPQAQSSAKASGMWQFMPATGRDFALQQNIFRDDRRGVLASTEAAIRYFKLLNKQFEGDWQLALAAYNWGQGNVQRTKDRQIRAGQPAGYTDLPMPDETRNYLPKLQAVKNIILRPEAFGLTLPPLLNHPYFVSVAIANDIDLDLAARLAGLSVDEFKQLNPQMNKPVILANAANGTAHVLLPYDAAETFGRALPLHKGPLASWTAWTAPRTLKPAEAARLVGMTESELREVNAIPARMLVKAQSTLLVRRDARREQLDVAAEVAERGMLAFMPEAPPLRQVQVKAGKRGDSVASIAVRYHVSAALVAQWNKTSASASFKPGQAVVLMLPPARSATQAHAKGVVRVAAKASGGRRAQRPSAPARMRPSPP